jgi:hypothetical protein
MSHVAHDNLPRTPPADRHEITYAATHHQPRRSLLVAQITIRVENRTGTQTVSILERNHLAAVKVPGQNQVIALPTRPFPDARIVRAENSNITFRQSGRIGAGNGDHSRTMPDSHGPSLNPSTPAGGDRVADLIDPDLSVVVAAHGKHRRDLAKRADQIAKRAKFSPAIDQIASQQQNVDFGPARGLDHLPAKMMRTPAPQVEIAHVHQAARIRPDGQPLLADVQGLL